MYEELIERLREYPDREETAGGYVEVDWQDLLDAADALEALTAQLAALQTESGELRSALFRVEAERDAAMKEIPQLAAQALETTPERLREMVKARREGRVVVLPCKRGDEVRATVQRPYNGHTAEINGIVSDIQTVVRVSYDGTRYVDFLGSDFGKTVFLTRAEAEAAIGGGGDG